MIRNSKLEIRNLRVSATPKLLLHACCAPCSTAVYEKLCADFDLTIYWYNPNIFPINEHNKRLKELNKLSRLLGFSLIIDDQSAINHQEWLGFRSKQFSNPPVGEAGLAIEQLASSPEGGPRCWLCYQYRLEKVARYARNHNFDYFATTLTVSPHKNTPKIIEIGKQLERKINNLNSVIPAARLDSEVVPRRKAGILFLAEDLKKNDGYHRSIELSKKYNLYRQKYCGCEFSTKI